MLYCEDTTSFVSASDSCIKNVRLGRFQFFHTAMNALTTTAFVFVSLLGLLDREGIGLKKDFVKFLTDLTLASGLCSHVRIVYASLWSSALICSKGRTCKITFQILDLLGCHMNIKFYLNTQAEYNQSQSFFVETVLDTSLDLFCSCPAGCRLSG